LPPGQISQQGGRERGERAEGRGQRAEGRKGPRTTDHGRGRKDYGRRTWRKSRKQVRSEKACVAEGESPSSLEAKLPEFRTKVMNGKV
jgi:hypothetical protein